MNNSKRKNVKNRFIHRRKSIKRLPRTKRQQSKVKDNIITQLLIQLENEQQYYQNKLSLLLDNQDAHNQHYPPLQNDTNITDLTRLWDEAKKTRERINENQQLHRNLTDLGQQRDRQVAELTRLLDECRKQGARGQQSETECKQERNQLIAENQGLQHDVYTRQLLLDTRTRERDTCLLDRQMAYQQRDTLIGQRDTCTTMLAQRNREITDLQQRFDTCTATLQQRENDINTLRQRVAELERQLELCQRRINELQQGNINATDLQRQLEVYRVEQNRLQTQLQDITRQNQELQARVTTITSESEERLETIKLISARLQTNLTEKDELQKYHDLLQTQLRQLHTIIVGYKLKIKESEQHISRVDNQYRAQLNNISKLEYQITREKENNARLTNELDQCKSKQSRFEMEKQELQSNLQALEQQREQIIIQNKELQAQIISITAERDERGKIIKDLQTQLGQKQINQEEKLALQGRVEEANQESITLKSRLDDLTGRLGESQQQLQMINDQYRKLQIADVHKKEQIKKLRETISTLDSEIRKEKSKNTKLQEQLNQEISEFRIYVERLAEINYTQLQELESLKLEKTKLEIGLSTKNDELISALRNCDERILLLSEENERCQERFQNATEEYRNRLEKMEREFQNKLRSLQEQISSLQQENNVQNHAMSEYQDELLRSTDYIRQSNAIIDDLEHQLQICEQSLETIRLERELRPEMKKRVPGANVSSQRPPFTGRPDFTVPGRPPPSNNPVTNVVRTKDTRSATAADFAAAASRPRPSSARLESAPPTQAFRPAVKVGQGYTKPEKK